MAVDRWTHPRPPTAEEIAEEARQNQVSPAKIGILLVVIALLAVSAYSLL